MMFSKSKLLLILVIVNSLKLFICKTTNDNVNNCTKDVQEYIGNPTTCDMTFIKKLFFEMKLTEIKSHYARIYFVFSSRKISIKNTMDYPFTFCSKKYENAVNKLLMQDSKYKACKYAMIKAGFEVWHYQTDDRNGPRFFNDFFFKYKKEDLQDNDVLEYMDTVFDSISSINRVELPKQFCIGQINNIMTKCLKSIEMDFNSCSSAMECTQTILQRAKKNDMKTNYGNLYYIELRDRIEGVRSGAYELKQLCDVKYKSSKSECINQLAEAGYKEGSDYQSILIHTYYNIVIDFSTQSKKPFLFDYVQLIKNSFQLRDILSADAISFCQRTVRHELRLEIVSIWEI